MNFACNQSTGIYADGNHALDASLVPGKNAEIFGIERIALICKAPFDCLRHPFGLQPEPF